MEYYKFARSFLKFKILNKKEKQLEFWKMGILCSFLSCLFCCGSNNGSLGCNDGGYNDCNFENSCGNGGNGGNGLCGNGYSSNCGSGWCGPRINRRRNRVRVRYVQQCYPSYGGCNSLNGGYNDYNGCNSYGGYNDHNNGYGGYGCCF